MQNHDPIRFIQLQTPAKEKLIESILAQFRGVLRRSDFILGKEVGEFEKKFAMIAGCDFAVGVNSGLDALILSLRAAGIGANDEVITVPNSFIASTAAIALVGAKPVFVDVGGDYNIDPTKIEEAIGPKTRAILAVHLTGNPCAMDKLVAISKRHGLILIEDAAQAIGATFGGKPVGGFGEFGCFSLHPLKNLHVWGDGGMITINRRVLSEDLKQQRNHGLAHRDESAFFSYNSRLDTMQAIVGLAFIELLKETTSARVHNADRYNEQLAGLEEHLTPPRTDRENASAVYHVYQIRAKRRDELARFLSAKGIETKIHYPKPIHLQKSASYLGYHRGDFPVTEQLAQEILSLPIRETLAESEISRICENIHSFYGR